MAGVLLLAGVAGAAPVVTNVAVVNITPSTFSVVWQTTPGATPAITIFADAAGATNLAGQLGVEYFPLHTGTPGATNAYARRLSQGVLRQKTANQGLAQVRISRCQPNTTYYYQVRESDGLGGVTLWPASGPLPSVTTALDSAFVVQSRQLLFSLPGLDPAGAIVLLANSNTPSLLAAVAGDGARSNEVYFSLSDLLDASGKTNYLPLGNQSFTATVLGTAGAETQTYSLNFTPDFLVGQGGLIALGDYAALFLGSNYVRAGASGSLPVGVYASGISNLSFTLNLPTNLFTSLSLQSVSPQVGAASLQAINSNTIVGSLSAVPGQTLEGDQQLAQLNYATVAGQPSVFLPLVPASLQAVNPDGSLVANLAAAPGRLVIVNHQPLVENLFDPSGGRSLALYGLPGYSYEVQQSTDGVSWHDFFRVPMASLLEVFSGMDTNVALVSYRALEFTADPPLLFAGAPGQTPQLLIYGVPGTNYVVQYATNLAHTVNWYPLLSCTLTNSFQLLSNLPNTNPAVFYRLKR